MRIISISFIILFNCNFIFSNQFVKNVNTNPELLKNRWNATWISCPDVSLIDYGVYIFRKKLDLKKQPKSFIINISADNRYRLFVNEQSVCWGPARGDIAHWYFETIDIAPFLNNGKNIIAIEVWNFGPYKPGAQTTLKTGVIIQGNSKKEEILNTDNTWKVKQNKAYKPSLDYTQDVGCNDNVNGALYPWGWQKLDYDDKNWKNTVSIARGQPYGTGTGYDWVLLPRDIPLMEESLLRMNSIRRSKNIDVPADFLKGKSKLLIPENNIVSFLIDQEYLTTAYPELIVSGGKGCEIKITYSEALFDSNAQKGNRNEVEGKLIKGFVDRFYPDGGEDRIFRPLWFRTYRFIKLDIETKEDQLIINDFYGKFVAYPFKENAYFESNDPSLKQIWDVGWRTARLCAQETYYDCPYYEQLQYVGDTRIQALISLYVDGDTRLMKKAINMFNWSRSYEGITTSRYPAHVPQYIPPFSLYWINMIHDYWMYRDEPDFVKECIPGIKTVLEWFSNKVDVKTGMLGPLPHWNFVDWPIEWPWNTNKPLGGVPPGGISGGSAIISLQFAYTLKDAIELLTEFNENALAAKYQSLYNTLCESVWKNCWNKEKKLLADDLNFTSYSQHANIMGILSDVVPHALQSDLFQRINQDSLLIQATFYYRFYLTRALNKVQLSDQYLTMLGPWYDMLNIGLTTFAENPEPTRSDCHAWSSSPVYDFLATVSGITPSSPGFKTVTIQPSVGHLKFISSSVPHPKGKIVVNLKRTDKGIKGYVILPDGLSGTFIWKNKKIQISSGKTDILI